MIADDRPPAGILVVDDNAGDFSLIGAYARLAGLVFAGASDALSWARTLAEALAVAHHGSPDVVLLDLSLPDSNGIATLQAVRDALPDVPIVVLAGKHEEAQAAAALIAGAQDFLIKGRFDHHALASAIRHARVRKALELGLAQTQQRLDLVLAGADLGLWDWNIASGHLTLNERSCTMLGYTLDEIEPHIEGWQKLVHADDLPAVEAAMRAHLNGLSAAYEFEYRMRHKAGHWVWVLDRGKVVERDAAGRPLRAAGTRLDITSRKQAEESLRESVARLRATLDSALDGAISIDASGRVVDFNPAAEAMFGWKKEEVLGRMIADLLVPEQHRSAHQNGLSRFVRTRQPRILNRRVEITALHRNGSEFPVELAITAIRQNDEDLFTAYLRDITQRKQVEDELRVAATAFESQEGMFVTDGKGVILRVNHAFTAITGYTGDDAIGQTPRFLNSGRHDADFHTKMWQSAKRSGAWQGEIWSRRKSGQVFPELLTITAVRNSDGRITHFVATLTDITLRKAAEDEMKNLAFYDPLTQLPNRRLVLDRLQQALAVSARTRHLGALLFLDLDNFKMLNDTLGHDMGDLLLQQVAERVVSCVREGDTAARLGGDEFVVMLEDLGENPLEAAAYAMTVGEKILARLGQPYALACHVYCSTPSIGVTLFGATRETVVDVLKRADIAMYRAKAAGRNTLRFNDAAMASQ